MHICLRLTTQCRLKAPFSCECHIAALPMVGLVPVPRLTQCIFHLHREAPRKLTRLLVVLCLLHGAFPVSTLHPFQWCTHRLAATGGRTALLGVLQLLQLCKIWSCQSRKSAALELLRSLKPLLAEQSLSQVCVFS